jgi:hypothetical protein
MWKDPHRHYDSPSSPPIHQGSSRAARAANLLVGATAALLLIALGLIIVVA